MMHDTHCHLDLYPNPYQVALDTEKAGILTIAVTNLPSAYFAAKPHMRRFRSLKLAIGLHPLLANEHSTQEKQLFQDGLKETRFVGEVGLDFSKHGIETKERQLESFRFVLSNLKKTNCFVTIHSRQAEATVFQLLTEFQVSPVVFHWYSGPEQIIDKIAEAGHFFSINTAMLMSKKGQKIANRIPKERLLTETDGPFVKIKKRTVVPDDVVIVHKYFSDLWNCRLKDVTSLLDKNFIQYLRLTN